MLDLSNEQRLMEKLWQATDEAVELSPVAAGYFFNCRGPVPIHFESRRRFHRYYLRTKAVLTRGTSKLGVYTTDVSREGIGFLCTRQLLPKESVQLTLPNGRDYHLRITRCRRNADGVYVSGGKFSIGDLPLDQRCEDDNDANRS